MAGRQPDQDDLDAMRRSDAARPDPAAHAAYARAIWHDVVARPGGERLDHGLRSIEVLYIEPGSPWQNGFVESFHGRLRDECLNREQLWTLTEARVVIEDYRCQYDHYRPHSKLGYQSPKRFAATTQSVPSPAPVAPGLLTPQPDEPRQTT